MAEEKPRIQRVLAHLYDAEGAVRPKDIADVIEESPLNVGKDLHSLKERGLAASKDEGQWEITPEGRGWLEGSGEKETRKESERKETAETVPAQSDIFRGIGEKLGVGARKGDIRLDAIIYYVQRTADLDNLTGVWNALTEMGVAGDVRKRWVKLYAQTIPGISLPEELKEKLELAEPDKVKAEADGISPKPRRFSVVGGEIIGDPEGDYSFREALQCVAQQRGASPEDANSLALALSKQSADTINAIIPLLSRESPSQGNMVTQIIQALKELGLGGKSDEGLKEQITALTNMVNELKEERYREQITTQHQQIQALANKVTELVDTVTDLRKPVTGRTEMDIIHEVASEGIGLAKTELSGLRRDVREAFFGSMTLPPPKTLEEREQRKGRYREAIETDKKIEEIGKRLFFGENIPEEEVASAPKPAPEPEPAEPSKRIVPLRYE